MKASGRLGMEAFLPSPSRTVPVTQGADASHNDDVPHLSLEERWQDGQFSLASTINSSKEVNVREWTLRLLERYRFVVGTCISNRAAIKRVLMHPHRLDTVYFRDAPKHGWRARRTRVDR